MKKRCYAVMCVFFVICISSVKGELSLKNKKMGADTLFSEKDTISSEREEIKVRTSEGDLFIRDSLRRVAPDTLSAQAPFSSSLSSRDSILSQSNSTSPVLQEKSKDSLSQLKPVLYTLPSKVWQKVTDLRPSTKALICAIIPGGGQLYNKQYWKIPIVWTVGTGCAYAIWRLGGQYNEYRTAYREFMSENPMQYDSWKNFVPAGKDPKDYLKDGNIRQRLKKGTESYRRNRDLSILVSVALYLLSVLDAYVDAELADYDMSPNLTLYIPTTHYEKGIAPGGAAIGLQYNLYF